MGRDRSPGAATGVPSGGGQWFARRFPAGPTAPQAAAWPRIAAGSDVLVASPTGTGKTLTGFLVAIDAAYRAHADRPGRRPVGARARGPLHLAAPGPGRRRPREPAGAAGGHRRTKRPDWASPPRSCAVAVRTGDTPTAERAAMRRSPPDLLVTTPESLYLLLTAGLVAGHAAAASTR